jgi:PAS domain S-box-containing protein
MSDDSRECRLPGDPCFFPLDPAIILDSANDAIILTDSQFRIIGWNKRAEEMHGFKKAEVIGKSVIDALVPAGNRRNATCMMKRLLKNDSFSWECMHTAKDSRKFPVRVSTRAVFDSSGRRVGYLGIVSDISEMKRKEERLRQRNSELRAFRAVVSALSSPMPIKEVLQRAIEAIVKVFSADAGAIFLLDGKGATFSPFAHQGASEELMQELASFAPKDSFSGRVVKSSRGLLISDVWAAKKRNWVLPATVKAGFRSLMGVPLPTKKGALGTLELASLRPIGFESQDLRFLRMLGWQVAGAIENAMLRDELGKSLRAKTRLVSEARHRLTNNLQAIASLLSTAVASERWTGDGKAAIDSAVRRISGMAAIQQQMDLDGLEAIELAEVIERIEGCILEIHGQQHEITFAVKGRGARLSASLASSLAIAINELVWNSCAHGFDPGERGCIGVEASVTNGVVKVEVKDSGKGISQDFDLERDSGTGLAIVKSLVERDLNGRLSLSREEGTIARITWPAEVKA